MTCYRPLRGFRSKERTKTGKRKIVFNRSNGFTDLPVSVPCGQCIGCRLEKSRQWAIRCTHEASLYEDNSFITLTYNNHNLPENKSLDVRHFQLFMKRLRKKRAPKPIRFFHCGEYGEKTNRPHYHAILFNCDFPDKKLWKIQNENRLYTSDELQEIWPFGFSTIGDATFSSAAYVARYVLKKITGEMAENHYEYINPETGEITSRKPEYTTMSRRPGIGTSWLKKWETDIYPDDFVVINGKKMHPPKFYDLKYEIEHPKNFRLIRSKRVIKQIPNKADNTDRRLRVRENVQKAQISSLSRNLNEEET